MGRSKFATALIGGVVLLLLIAATQTAAAHAATPNYNCETDDCNQYAEGYDGGTGSEDWQPQQTCRVVTKLRYRNTWWGHRSWNYVQRVHWCWNASVITSVNRTRWPEVNCCFWRFDGHIGNSCASENCAEQYGRNYAYIATVGQMRYCNAWCALEKDPGVGMNIYRGGSYSWGTWG